MVRGATVHKVTSRDVVGVEGSANHSVIEFLRLVQGMRRALSHEMSGARHFRELVCWQLANELKLGIYRLAEQPPVKRDFKFYDQIRDAAASAPRNIAEGFGRRSHADFARFLDVARGSLAESQNPPRMRLIVDTCMIRNSND